MTKIKLKDWADKHGLSYITANRHFHAGMIPGAVQLDSGTILVEDESLEQLMVTTATAGNSDAMSLFLKKTVEFSKNNATVEDFAAYIISNFQLRLNSSIDVPKYSKQKPKSEEVQKHFQKFIPNKEVVEHLKNVKNGIINGQVVNDIFPASLSPMAGVSSNDTMPSVSDEEMLQMLNKSSSCVENIIGGLVTQSVDPNTTPQINYTSSTIQPPNNVFSSASTIDNNYMSAVSTTCINSTTSFLNDNGSVQQLFYSNIAGPFQPTQKELQSATQVIETADSEEIPRKRGRKPSRKR